MNIFLKSNCIGGNKKFELDLSNYATKTDLKNSTGVDISKFAKKIALPNLKSNAYKLDIDKLKNVPSGLISLKSKVDKLDIDKLVPAFVGLSKLSDVIKNDVVKKDVDDAKMKNIEDKIPDITNLATKTTLNDKINEVQDEIPTITNFVPTTALTTIKNKIPNVTNLVKKLTITQKLVKLKKKITDHVHDKYITTPEFNTLTAEILMQD